MSDFGLSQTITDNDTQNSYFVSDSQHRHLHAKPETSSWIGRLLDDYQLEAPPVPSSISAGDVPGLEIPEEHSQSSGSFTKKVPLPSKRFLEERFHQIHPSCCVNKRTALQRAAKKRVRHLLSLSEIRNTDAKVPRRRRKSGLDIIATRGAELFEVVGVGFPDDEPQLRDAKHQEDTPESSPDEPVWFSKTTLKFGPCRPSEESRQFLYMTNQTIESVDFSWAIVGDPRLHARLVSNENPRESNHAETLQEKPFFRQVNMKFDPVIHSTGPIAGSDKLPFVDSWFQSYRRLRERDNYSGTGRMPVSTTEFIAGVAPYGEPLKESKFQKTIAEFFHVEPWSGTLPPMGSICVCVRFRPWFLITAHAQMLCMTNNANQALRSVYLIGPCARVNVDVKPKFVDLGTCLYDTMLERTVNIVNRGRYPALFTIERAEKLTKDKLVHPEFDTVYTSTVSGRVIAQKNLAVNVYYVPGKPGKFVKHFYVCVRGETAVRVDFRGNAVYQRVDLDLPQRISKVVKKCRTKKRPDICEDVMEEDGVTKRKSVVQDVLVSHWAKRAQETVSSARKSLNNSFVELSGKYLIACEMRPRRKRSSCTAIG